MNADDVDGIVDELQSRVHARRLAGDYPLGLEQQLEAHFSAMLDLLHDQESNTATLSSNIDRVGAAIGSLNSTVGTSSRVPGGKVVHEAVAAMIQRHTQQVVGQVGTLGSAVHDSLIEVRDVLDRQRHSDDRNITEVLSAVMDRLAVVDHLSELLLGLSDRLDRLEGRSDS
jgi:hypothetical protein